ncbi:MAG TPA: antibiotic biosynthesis monooxygenase [Dehalococcoidia bacterium]|nr:antibiotic biosynthesis monooxygenase [Dehalococcoidia bacterium]
MIAVTAEFRINEGKEDEAIAAIEKLVAAVNESEPGTLMYTWHRGIKDAAQVLVYEQYEDEEAMKVHSAGASGPHLAEFQKAFAAGVFDPSSVKIARFGKIAEISR